MKVIQKTEENDIAIVYVAQSDNGRMMEFVESVQPPYPIEEKWVLLVSTLFGCPVKCGFCDAGGNYKGKLSFEEMMFQIDYMIRRRFLSNTINVKKLKIQFARMGEPSFNMNVVRVLEELPHRYNFETFIPSISTIAPSGTDRFFEKLLKIKNSLYRNNFQLQFSIHSTDEKYRDFLMPIRKWDLKKISEYGECFYNENNRKITLNFALTQDAILDPQIPLKYFEPTKFLVKITPVNPTFKAKKNRIESYVQPHVGEYKVIDKLREIGFEVILSIGVIEENKIGSNCGQYVQAILKGGNGLPGGYSYHYKMAEFDAGLSRPDIFADYHKIK